MSKVKYNHEQYYTMSEKVDKAETKVIEAMNLWGENFDNLYYAFIDSGFLESLYKDAESQYYNLVNAGYVITDTVSGVATGAVIGSIFPGAGTVIGAIIGGVLGLLQGIFLDSTKNPNEVNWHYESKQAFEALLTACVYGEDDAYINLLNLKTKLDSVTVSLIEIQAKIDEFNKIYADLSESAQKMGLKTKLASDGVTMLGIETSVTIDGKKVDMTMSDAMNAFYTYTGTVISSEIQAQYMQDTYGAEINYMDLVNNANGFMVKTIESGLYSHEFVDAILPFYEPNTDQAFDVVSGGLGITTDKFDSILTDTLGTAGVAGLSLGLIGASFIGDVGSALNRDDKQPNQENTSPSGSNENDKQPNQENNNPSGGSNGNNGGNGGAVPTYPNNNNNNNNDNNNDNNSNKEDDKEDQKDEDKNEEQNDIEIIDIKEFDDSTLNIIDEFEMPKIDYDEMARIEYEARGEEAIAEERILAITNANALFDNTDKTPLIMNLKNFGYDDSEIEVIITNRDYTITAFVEGSQRKTLTGIANQLATKDGVADFDTIYDDGQTLADIENGNSNKLVSIMSSDPKVSEAQTKMLDSQKSYKDAYEKMQQSYTDVQESKKELETLKAEIVSKYGEDPKKWSKEDATKYNTAIEEYNKKVEQVQTEIEATKEAENAYQDSVEDYDIAKAAFFKQIIEDQQKQAQKQPENLTQSEPAVQEIVEPTPETTQNYDEGRPVTEEDLNGLVVGPDGIKFE